MLADFRQSFDRRIIPVIAILNWAGFTPNKLSALALVLAMLSAFSYYASHLLLALLFLISSALLDALDGPLARMLNKASMRGDLVDHAFDRFADAAVMAGITLSGLVSYEAGLFALIGTMLTSYMGTQAQALGVGRVYGGLSGRADRIAIIATATFLQIFGHSVLDFAMLVLGILGVATAVQRFIIIYEMLDEEAERREEVVQKAS